jgi:hypothetical protein
MKVRWDEHVAGMGTKKIINLTEFRWENLKDRDREFLS